MNNSCKTGKEDQRRICIVGEGSNGVVLFAFGRPGPLTLELGVFRFLPPLPLGAALQVGCLTL